MAKGRHRRRRDGESVLQRAFPGSGGRPGGIDPGAALLRGRDPRVDAGQVEGEERVTHGGCRPEPFAPILLETSIDDVEEPGRQVGPQLDEGYRLLEHDGEQRLDGGVALEGPVTGEALVQHDGEGPEVGPAVDGTIAAGLLGREESGRADDVLADREVRLGGRPARHAEVEHLHRAVVAEEEVSRLEVTVDDAEGVGRLEPGAGLQGQGDGFGGREERLGHTLA